MWHIKGKYLSSSSEIWSCCCNLQTSFWSSCNFANINSDLNVLVNRENWEVNNLDIGVDSFMAFYRFVKLKVSVQHIIMVLLHMSLSYNNKMKNFSINDKEREKPRFVDLEGHRSRFWVVQESLTNTVKRIDADKH